MNIGDEVSLNTGGVTQITGGVSLNIEDGDSLNTGKVMEAGGVQEGAFKLPPQSPAGDQVLGVVIIQTTLQRLKQKDVDIENQRPGEDQASDVAIVPAVHQGLIYRPMLRNMRLTIALKLGQAAMRNARY